MTPHSRTGGSHRRFLAKRSARIPLAMTLALLAVPAAAHAADAETTEPAATTCPAEAEGQSIEMWSPLTGPDGETMTGLAERFSSENELGISVEHVAQPEYVQKL